MKKLLLLLLCVAFELHGQNKELDSLYRVLEGHSQKDTVRFNLLISVSKHLLSNSEKSKEYINEAIAIATQLGFKKGIAEGHNYLTHYFWYRTDFAQAVEHGLTALRLRENINDSMGLFEANVALAGVYMSWKDFKKAEEYLDKALILADQNKSKIDFGDLYDKVGFFKLQQNKVEEGIDFVNKSLAIKKERNDTEGQASCYFLLAKAQQKLGNTKATLEYYQNAIRLSKLSKELGVINNIASSHEGMGEIYVQLKEFNKASLHLDTALQIARQINAVNMTIRVYRDRAALNEAKGNFREALRYERLNRQLQDSVLNEQKSQQVAEAQVKYETEKKEQTILLLGQEKKFQDKLRNLLVLGIALLGLSTIAIYLLQRSRARKAKQLLTIQESLNTKLIEVDKLKSRFFANISHEFRTPLTLILSPIEEKLLAEGISQKDRISFQTIKRSANRLLELINQVLELSKLESGFMKLNPQPGNLYNFIMPVLSSFDSMADVSQVRYTKEVRIPESPLFFDGDKIEKILTNLLSNAFKFSPKGGNVEIMVLANEKAKSVELTIKVKNIGTAITPDTLDKMFEPFFQGDNTSTRWIPGTGLGLSLVKELVKLNGGDIHVASTASEGTVLTVALTLEKSDMSVAIPAIEKMETIAYAEAAPETILAETDATKETILIVEDNGDVRNLIRQGFETKYNILEASTGKEGVEMAMTQQIDLVVSDVMMPVMGGVELCHILKNDENTSHLPIILLTARADHESKLEGLNTGADDYVIKPFNMEELQVRIANLIGQRKRLIKKYNQHIIVQPHEITVTPLDERFIQKAIQLMEENLDNIELSVDKMSEGLGMSRTNLNRKLKAVTGFATNEFIQDFRLRRAALLIEKKADSISQIAYQVGFNDQSYFTKCFKKKFGKTPSEFGDLL
jgi:signal transduction histidine kinase/DNA-binding response OmpR family regulator